MDGNTEKGHPLTRGVKIAMLQALERNYFTPDEASTLVSFLQGDETCTTVEIIDHRLFIVSDYKTGTVISDEEFEERLEDARRRFEKEKERCQ